MAITLKKLSGDTEVIPNPTLDGTETALSGLQIDGVKYAMGGSGGTPQWVLKESYTISSHSSKLCSGTYANKLMMVLQKDVYDRMLMFAVISNNVTGYYLSSDGSYYDWVFIEITNTKDKFKIHNRDSTTRVFELYEIEVA